MIKKYYKIFGNSYLSGTILLIIIYAIFQTTFFILEICAIWSDAGHIISIAYLFIIYLVLIKPPFSKKREGNPFIYFNLGALVMTIIIMSIFLLIDLCLAINSITVPGGLI